MYLSEEQQLSIILFIKMYWYWFITATGSPNNIFITDRVFTVHYYETTQQVLFNYFYAIKKSLKKYFLIISTYSILLFTLVHGFFIFIRGGGFKYLLFSKK